MGGESWKKQHEPTAGLVKGHVGHTVWRVRQALPGSQGVRNASTARGISSPNPRILRSSQVIQGIYQLFSIF